MERWQPFLGIHGGQSGRDHALGDREDVTSDGSAEVLVKLDPSPNAHVQVGDMGVSVVFSDARQDSITGLDYLIVLPQLCALQVFI